MVRHDEDEPIVFDGRLPGRSRRGMWAAVLIAVMLAVAATGWIMLTREPLPAEPVPLRVVADRPGGARRAPGATINEAEAIRLLRRHLVTTGLAVDCLVIKSEGQQSGTYLLSAFNRCEDTRLGRWSVDGKTGQVRGLRAEG